MASPATTINIIDKVRTRPALGRKCKLVSNEGPPNKIRVTKGQPDRSGSDLKCQKWISSAPCETSEKVESGLGSNSTRSIFSERFLAEIKAKGGENSTEFSMPNLTDFSHLHKVDELRTTFVKSAQTKFTNSQLVQARDELVHLKASRPQKWTRWMLAAPSATLIIQDLFGV